MEIVGNLVLQFFAYVVLPILLPIFLFAILLGIRSPERLISEVLGTTLSICTIVLQASISLFVALFKLLFKNGKRRTYGNGGSGLRPDSGKGSGDRRRKLHLPRA